VSIADLHERIPGIEDVPIVGILRRLPLDLVVHLVWSAREAGLRVVEVTLDSDSALDQIRILTNEVSDCTVGVGSARDSEDVAAAVQAGARFVVSPVFSESVARSCEELGVPHLPGAATPTEIHTALASGATAVKVFPAEQLGGPSFLRAVASPLGEPPLMPTGGVRIDNAKDYLDAGACAIGVGSNLFPPDLAGASSDLIGEHVGKWIEATGR
jgi:2-dehydro-3-deoxyphosphogluconate aldolase / (4S)-4-hydroxy-2-oxoglutarate aldolase